MTKARDGDRTHDPGVLARANELTEGMLRLQSKVELAERFLANAAHEMKTPLANVRGELQLALMRDRSAEEYRFAITAALGHTERLIELTNDLLTFAKVSYSPVLPPAEPCNVKALVTSALQIALQGKVGKRSIDVRVAPELSVMGRAEELIRMFRNLLDNALSYSPDGSAVLVAAEGLPEQVSIRVENEGEVLAAERAETLFLPFQRGSSSGAGGFGLGLGIARAIARGHEGELVLDPSTSRPSFVVTLPAVSSPVSE